MVPNVYLARCDSYQIHTVRAAVKRIFAAFGGAKALCGGKRVLVKPNLLMAFEPETCTTTHPAVVQAVVEELQAAGCEVTIADSAGGLYNTARLEKLYRNTGLLQVAEATGAQLNYDTSASTMRNPKGKLCKSFSIIQPVQDAEFIVNLAKMKTHGFMYYTGAAKNLFGVIPGLTKPAMHSQYPKPEAFASMMVDLCECVKPGFSIIDGVFGMEGHGPSAGSPKEADVLIGARNPYAADLAAMHIMGFEPKDAPICVEAIRRGLVPAKVELLSLHGDPIGSFRTEFKPAKETQRSKKLTLPHLLRKITDDAIKVYPVIRTADCVGCGECMRTCPRGAIQIIERKAVIDYSKCIRCYCCHELCPKRAINFSRKGNPGSRKQNKSTQTKGRK